jgi:hypothetical protein
MVIFSGGLVVSFSFGKIDLIRELCLRLIWTNTPGGQFDICEVITVTTDTSDYSC